jgi:3-hydroxybutyryl-CoA dehydrogenase
MSEQTIGIVGGGLMGHGIAYLLAAVGHKVAIYEPSGELRATLPQRLKAIAALLDDDPVLTEKISAHEALAPAMQGATFVFEAAPEKLPLKQQLFTEIERHVAADTILASNSSAIPSTEIGRYLEHRERVLGTHFWNPPHLVPLVEVVQNEKTGVDVVRKTMALLRDAGKVPVHVRRDVPGFVGNRLQHALWREAISLVENDICDAETVDTVIKAAFGRRLAVLGPLENADLVGTDLTLAIHRTVLPAIDARPSPSPYLEKLVAQGKLGMKSGEGFRTWTPEQQAELRARVLRHLKAARESG